MEVTGSVTNHIENEITNVSYDELKNFRDVDIFMLNSKSVLDFYNIRTGSYSSGYLSYS